MLPGCVAAVGLPLQERHSPPDIPPVGHQRSHVAKLVQAGRRAVQVASDVKLVTDRVQQNLGQKK